MEDFSMRARIAATLVAIASICAAAFAQGPRRDGKWEVTMEMDMPGMPMKMQPMTTTHCVTKEQADNPQKMIPQQGRGRGNDNCKVTDQKIEGSKVSWTMNCP